MRTDHEDVFPAEHDLFEETFSSDCVYKFCGEEFQINQVFSANLGVAAPVWDSAIHLCQFFESQSFDLSGKRVIELGSGTGIVGILAARLGAEVTITDLPHALPQLQRNVSDNAPASGWPYAEPTVLPLSWGLDQEKFSTSWDLVLGADIVYLADTYPLLLNTLAHLCKGGAVAYLASKIRLEHSTHIFYNSILPQKFKVELKQRESEQNISIYKATLRSFEV